MFPKEQGLYSPRFEHDNCGAGFICSLKGKKTNDIIHKALDILCKLEHRGAVSSDGKTGDGAGILIEIPHDFFISKCDFKIPKINEYAVGMTFLPSKKDEREICIKSFEKEILNQGLKILGWRNVPVDKKHMGKIASKTEPYFKQVLFRKGKSKFLKRNSISNFILPGKHQKV